MKTMTREVYSTRYPDLNLLDTNLSIPICIVASARCPDPTHSMPIIRL